MAKRAGRATAPDAAGEVGRLLAEGMAHHRAGRIAAAIVAYRRVLKLDADHAEATGLLGLAALQQGDPASAVDLISRATVMAPDSPSHHCNLGVALNAAGRQEEAVLSFARAIELKPDYAEAWSNRGMALKHLHRPEAAVENHRQAIALRPNEPGFHVNLGNALVDLGELHEAEAAYRKALELRPGYANALSGLSLVLQELGRGEEAVAAGEEATARQPRNPEHLRHLGRAYRQAGRLDKAASAYRRALEVDPGDAESWRLLTNVEALPAPSAELDTLERLWRNPAVPNEARIHAGLALGRWLDDLGEYERSFDSFVEANRLRRRQIQWSETEARRDFGLIESVFDPLPEVAPLPGGRAPGPIFVVGLPRAGKTTLEGMLARHEDVRATGELKILSILARDLSRAHNLSRPGAHISEAPADALAQVRERYMEYVRHLAPAPFIPIDTMPPNFRNIGVLRLAMPEARIIHCTREPLEHCVAVFRKYFARAGYQYSYDLSELAIHYRLYRRLMALWRRVAPGFVLDVNVADLRRDPEAGMRRVLDFCGLKFDSRCAAFHESEPRLNAEQLPPGDHEARLAPYRAILAPLLAGAD